MKQYDVRIKFLSETMLGSGMAVPGVIDNDIRHDNNGLPYMNAKTFKGHIREQMEFLKKYDKSYRDIDIYGLLGSDDKDSEKKLGKIKFSEVSMPQSVKEALKQAVNNGKLSKSEVLNSITVIYTRTRINEFGVAEAHSLRKERELKKNLMLETKIYTEDLTDEELKMLYESVKALKHIGMHKSKGKGLVECSIEPAKEGGDI
ncbi:MAG: hypothetical protein E7271_09945 [Lachnospiraceae bacterium]|nr:hypothetical protein [Lachnospiraceae bacterium]